MAQDGINDVILAHLKALQSAIEAQDRRLDAMERDLKWIKHQTAASVAFNKGDVFSEDELRAWVASITPSAKAG